MAVLSKYAPEYKKEEAQRAFLFFGTPEERTRKGGTRAHTGAKIVSWRVIFSPWESPNKQDGILVGCWLAGLPQGEKANESLPMYAVLRAAGERIATSLRSSQ